MECCTHRDALEASRGAAMKFLPPGNRSTQAFVRGTLGHHLAMASRTMMKGMKNRSMRVQPAT
eukprot:2910683-Amphidinium_carterae.1